VLEKWIRPADEVFHVGAVFVAAVVLAPSECAVDEAVVHGWFLRGAVVSGVAEVTGAEEAAPP